MFNEELDNKASPVIMPMRQLAQGIGQTQSGVDPLLLEAMAASNWDSILCFDQHDNTSQNYRSENGTWRQPIYLKDLLETCDLVQIGIVIATDKTSIVLSPGTINRLNGIEFDPFKYQSPGNIDERDIGISLLDNEQIDFFPKCWPINIG